jgi:hypothetical protein
MKKFLQIANGLALIATIIVNYLSNTGFFNGNTMATVSARYQNLFTPAAYAFSIWGLIYLALLAFVVFQGRSLFPTPVDGRLDKTPAHAGPAKTPADDAVVEKIGGWFILSCVANCSWVLLWLYDYTGLSVLVMIVLLFSLLMIVLNTNMEMDDAPLRTIAFVWWPFCFYSGWITVALFANVAAWLTKIQWNNGGFPETTRAIIMLLVTGAIFVFMTWKRNMREYATVGVWGLIAIAIPNWHQAPMVAFTALAVAVLLFINVSAHAYRNRAFSPWTWNARHPGGKA